MITDFYRPEWTCGRYHKKENRSHALVYNLLEGMAYFFEDESADIVGGILQFQRNDKISIDNLKDFISTTHTPNEISNFCNELVNVGLLTEGLLSDQTIQNNRKQIGELRCQETVSIEKSVIERLPFHQDDAENAYMDILEKSRIPFVVMFELTYNCNEKCVHCFNPGASRNDTEKSERNNREEIDLKHYEILLKELKELGVVKIILTGGDPFVKKDIWELIKLIYEGDFALDIYTNGLALLGRVGRLAQFYPRSIGLSVYSAKSEIHDSITRVKGSLNKTLLVAKDIVQYGIPLYFKCPIMNHNATSYYTVAELAKQYGATPQIDITLTDSVDGDTAIGEQLQVDGELLEIILRDPNIPLYVGKEAPSYGSQEREKDQAFCGAGTVLMNITPEGDVTPCNSFPTQFGNIKNISFLEIWSTSQSLNSWQQITVKDYDECGTHERCNYCNRCPGQSFIEHGTPLKASTANCYNANMRMNLANKLKKGIDPLKGQNLEQALTAFENIPSPINSNKQVTNFRNAPLIVKKKFANS